MEKEEKLKRFMSDVAMQRYVYEVILDTFIQPNDASDVHNLAAQRISISMLQIAWKELEKYKIKQEEEKTKGGQVGL